MQYKHFYRAIIFRIALVMMLTAGIVYLYLEKDTLVLCIFLLLILIGVITNTIRYFNNINHWIAFFLLGIENEDSTLKIPRKTGSKAIDEVFKGMNRLNEIFKQTKIEISAQEQYFKTVINQSSTGLFSVNSKGRIININPSAEKLTRLAHYHHINSLSRIDVALPKVIMDDKTNLDSTIFENRRGQKILFKISNITSNNEIIKLVAVSDITKELDSREVDAWVKLARTLSHEIMNSITPITTLSNVILNYFMENNKAKPVTDLEQKTIDNSIKGLEVIEERSSGLLKFVDNYRKFTKLPEPEMLNTDIIKLMNNAILACSTFKGFENIKIEKRIPENLFIETDEDLLSQVLINLIKNAIEHFNEIEKIDDAFIHIAIEEGKESTKIELCNNGEPIAPELREQIFVPFFTTKESGSGIGLSLSKQIVLKLGGDISLSTNSRGFTCFTIYL